MARSRKSAKAKMMTTQPRNEQERLDWLRLARTEGVGPITFRQLLRRFETAKAALAALPSLSSKGGRAKPLSPPSLKTIEDECRALEKRSGRFLFLGEPDYPEPLAAIEDAPPILSVLGHASLLSQRVIGIVGARNASLSGRKMAEALSRDIGAGGFVVASGLARGIDASAHSHALATGTIAVVAGGVDVIYPEENRALYEKIAEAGCIVSEQPFGLEPRAQLFPRRNRIISGLSLGIVVVEAARKSGSLITARMALEQGREVFAVPGSPMDPRAGGTNDLIRQGAILTERAQDVFDGLPTRPNRLCEAPSPPLDELFPPTTEAQIDAGRLKILENLSTCPVPVDELARSCQLSLPVVATVLLELELAGRLDRQPGHKVALIG